MILITGGFGFIGLHAAGAFLEAGEDVVLVKHRSSDIPTFLTDYVDDRLFVEALDLSDANALGAALRKHDVDGVIHLAAPPLAADSVSEEFEMNFSALTAVVEASREQHVKRVTIASSIAVYRALGRGPFHEETPLPVDSVLGVEAVKKSFEVLADYYGRKTGLDIVCLRISSVYGPLYRGLVNAPSRMVHAAVRGETKPLDHPVVPGVYADAGMDFLYADDCARGICQVQLAAKLNHRIYNLGAGRATTPREFADALARVAPDTNLALEEGPGPHRWPDAYLDLTRIREDVGFEAKRTTQSAVEDYVSWLKRGNKF